MALLDGNPLICVIIMINRKKYETTAKLGMDTRQLSNNNVVTGQVLVQRGLNPFTRILLLHSVICPGMGQSMIEDRALGIFSMKRIPILYDIEPIEKKGNKNATVQ